MSRPARFYLPSLHDGQVTLDGPEAHHLLKVRRLGEGAVVELFDGSGQSAEATIVSTTRRDATLEVGTIESEPAVNELVTLAIGFPKPDRARWMVEKLTELGVAKIIPLKTEFSQSSGKPINTTKLNQYVIDACKQCGRNRLMAIDEPVSLDALLADKAINFLLADAEGEHATAVELNEKTVVLIGPEAGFSASERQNAIEAGANPVSFAANILRVETAAIAAALLLRPGQA
ncbi:MAG: 16S rRNA (uracil(1498)-N(3))-methyltransferase [Planctomycetaceae bacterium]